jgi:hypothetical protein
MRERGILFSAPVPRKHRPDCPGTRLCTLDRHDSAADVCRDRGWSVGTVLEGEEGHGPSRITITAIGRRQILAQKSGGDSYESTWTLSCRCWGEVHDTLVMSDPSGREA